MTNLYDYIIDVDGELEEPRMIGVMLDTWSGDVVGCVEQMYGMIWYLASRLDDLVVPGHNTPGWVEEARQCYEEGLRMSPTQRFQKETSE